VRGLKDDLEPDEIERPRRKTGPFSFSGRGLVGALGVKAKPCVMNHNTVGVGSGPPVGGASAAPTRVPRQGHYPAGEDIPGVRSRACASTPVCSANSMLVTSRWAESVPISTIAGDSDGLLELSFVFPAGSHGVSSLRYGPRVEVRGIRGDGACLVRRRPHVGASWDCGPVRPNQALSGQKKVVLTPPVKETAKSV